MIIVGQRVATIADADKIIVLEHGEIVGSGTHRRTPRALSDLRRDRRLPAQRRGGGRMSTGNGQDRSMRPEPVEGPSRARPGASTSSARSTSGNGQSAPKAPERPKYGPPAGGGGGRMWGQARPVEKSLNFFPSLKRLLGHLAPERMILSLSRAAGRHRNLPERDRTQDLGHGDGCDLHRVSSARVCRAEPPRSRWWLRCGPRATTPSPTWSSG